MNRQHPPLSGVTLALVTVSLALATFMNVLDTTIANVSIPAIAGALSVTPTQGTWIITSYAVCSAVMLPLTGWLAKRFGEVRMFIACTLLFSVASLLCGMAPTFEALTFFRALQGGVAGPMIPLSQTLLLKAYPKEKHGLALALWGMTTVVAPIVGPILGGYLTDNVGWSWIFYINVPVGFVCAYVSWRLLKERESAKVDFPVDLVGLGLMVVGVVSLQMALDWGSEVDWFDSSLVTSLVAVAVVTLTFFFAWERHEPHPVVDLTLFANRNFTVATVAISVGYMAFFSAVVIFPLWLQTQMGYTATWAGVVSAPIGVLTIIFMPIVGANLHRLDLRIIVTFGFVVFAATMYWHTLFTTDVTAWDVAKPRLLQGLGMACFFVPLTGMALSGMPPERFASASGMTNFLRMLGGSFGASLTITLWDHRISTHHASLAENLSAYDRSAPAVLDAMTGAGLSPEGALTLLDRIVGKQAVMLATNDVFLVGAAIFLCLAGFVWLARPPFAPARGATEKR